MSEINLYPQEIEDGITSLASSVAFCSQINAANVEENEKERILNLLKSVATNQNQIDLFYLNTILVSIGWNKNTDIFTKEEVWAARNTPEDKPFNYEHNQNDIIGHITGSSAIDEDGKIILSETKAEDLPDKFHILTSAVLYKAWSDEKLRERMEDIIAEIAESKWFVSMECLFANFDYGVIKPDGTNTVIARNAETSFLTKHLRAYGGTGEYNGHKLGRVLRNITFSGKGLVRKPANPESVILSDPNPFNSRIIIATANEIKELEMSKELETKNAELETSIANLNKSVAELTVEVKGEKENGEKLSKEVASLKTSNEELTNKLSKTEAEFKVAKEENEKLTKASEALTAELTKIKADEKKRSRLVALEKVGKTGEQAAALLADFDKFDDETFGKVVALIVPAKVEEKVAEKLPEDDKNAEKANAGELEKLESKEVVVEVKTEEKAEAHEKTVAGLHAWFEEITKEKK